MEKVLKPDLQVQLLVLISNSAVFGSQFKQYYKPDDGSTVNVVNSDLHTQSPLWPIVVVAGSHFMHLNVATESDKGNVKPELHSQSLFTEV